MSCQSFGGGVQLDIVFINVFDGSEEDLYHLRHPLVAVECSLQQGYRQAALKPSLVSVSSRSHPCISRAVVLSLKIRILIHVAGCSVNAVTSLYFIFAQKVSC